MSELNQLLLRFDQKQNFTYNDYYVSKSNFFAFKLIDSWPKWGKNIINIYGEEGCGKSHLAKIFEEKNKALKFNETQFNNEKLSLIKPYENVILDNFTNKTDENLLYSLFNLVDQDNKYLIINSRLPITQIKFNLKDLSSRTKNCVLAEILKPDDDLIFALIVKNFSDKQIYLEKKIIEYIVKRIDRSYRKISEFIYKIDEISLKKKKPINLKTVKELI
tara:strand:- start:133 stop:789 length:657 start_codon:yes stop_codon:yes gene_type:complete